MSITQTGKRLQYLGEVGEVGDVGEYLGDEGDICAGASKGSVVQIQ